MMKKILSLLLVLSLLTGLGLAACAEGVGGKVTFNGKKLITEFSDASFSGATGSLQPGDEAEIQIELVNKYSKKTDWWLKNEILENFLSSEKGGAYTYKLSFVAPNGSESVVYESGRVGGVDLEGNSLNGLMEINDALKDYVYLGTLGAGKTGALKLYIKLDGETQGNDYMGQLAKLQLKFAVEPTSDKIVMTGDETNTMPYLAGAAISGVVLLALAFLSLGKERKKREGEAK